MWWVTMPPSSGMIDPSTLHRRESARASKSQGPLIVRVATGGATTSPPPLAGEGQGGGINAPISIACPLPTPPPRKRGREQAVLAAPPCLLARSTAGARAA